MLTEAELAIFRGTQATHRFDLTATITRNTGVDDGAGGKLPGLPITFTSPCCRAPHKAADREEMVGESIQGVGTLDISFPALTDIRMTDQITIGDKGYEVISLYGPKSRETVRVVLCVER